MENITIYANYGLLAHEKQTVFSENFCVDAILSEKQVYSYPNDFNVYVNGYGSKIIVFPDGNTFYLSDVLMADEDDCACFCHPYSQMIYPLVRVHI